MGAQHEAAFDALFDGQWAILDVEPTTVAGVIAFLDCVTEFSADGRRLWSHRRPDEGEVHALGEHGSITFQDDAMRFVSRSLKRLLA